MASLDTHGYRETFETPESVIVTSCLADAWLLSLGLSCFIAINFRKRTLRWGQGGRGLKLMAYFYEKFEVVLVNKWKWPRLCHLNGMLYFFVIWALSSLQDCIKKQVKPSDASEHKVVRESQWHGDSQEAGRSSASCLALLLCQQRWPRNHKWQRRAKINRSAWLGYWADCLESL